MRSGVVRKWRVVRMEMGIGIEAREDEEGLGLQ